MLLIEEIKKLKEIICLLAKAHQIVSNLSITNQKASDEITFHIIQMYMSLCSKEETEELYKMIVGALGEKRDK